MIKVAVVTVYDMYEADVVVIGAGPAGSTAAREVSMKGYNVFLIEKDAYPGKNNVCGGCLHRAWVKKLSLPSGIVEKNISKTIYHFPRQTYVKNTPHIIVQRRVFDRFLTEKAVEQGSKLLVSTLALDVTPSRVGIVVSLKNRVTGENLKVKGKLVIFADGPNTLVSKKFKQVGFGRKERKAFAAIYEIEWRNNPFEHLELFFDTNVSPWGYGWIFPNRDLLNVGVGVLMSKMQSNIKTYLDFLVNKHPIASRKLRGRPKLRFAADIIPAQHAHKIYGDRILVVGDAAGMVDPIWGAGIGYAIRGSMLAAKVAVKALEENTFDETFLSQFKKEWKRGETYKHIRKIQLLSRLFILYSRFDKNAYLRLQTLLAMKGGAYKFSQTDHYGY